MYVSAQTYIGIFTDLKWTFVKKINTISTAEIWANVFLLLETKTLDIDLQSHDNLHKEPDKITDLLTLQKNTGDSL